MSSIGMENQQNEGKSVNPEIFQSLWKCVFYGWGMKIFISKSEHKNSTKTSDCEL